MNTLKRDLKKIYLDKIDEIDNQKYRSRLLFLEDIF